MRFKQGFVLILSGLVILAGSVPGRAQRPSRPGSSLGRVSSGFSSSAAASAGLTYSHQRSSRMPPSVAARHQMPSPAAAGQSRVRVPAQAMPSPGLSPYDYRFDQHRFQNGLWYRSRNNRPRKFFGSIDFLMVRTREPDALIGHTGAQSYLEMVEDELEGIEGEDGQQQQQDGEGSLVDRFRGDPELGFPGGNFYNAINANRIGEADGLGLRARWGFFEPDESGLALRFTWIGDDTDTFSAEQSISTRQMENSALFFEALNSLEFGEVTFGGDQQDGDQAQDQMQALEDFNLPGDLTVQELFEQNLLNLSALPLDDGTIETFDGTTLGGVSAPYDLAFKLNFESRRIGGGLRYYMTPAYQSEHVKVRPVLGLRYENLREKFAFFGRDSGLLFGAAEEDGQQDGDQGQGLGELKLQSFPDGIDGDGDGIIDNAGRIEGTGEEDGQQQQDGDGESTFIKIRDPLTSSLQNDVETNLAGPQVGLRYDVFGEKFRLWGQSIGGVLGNHERLELKGNNIGPTTRPEAFLQPTPGNRNPNAFSDEVDHTHVSPLFEQTFVFQGPVFSFVPVVKEIGFLSAADVRLSYTFLFVGEVARPAASIRWQGNPSEGLFPEIDLERGSYTQHMWSVGLNWQY